MLILVLTKCGKITAYSEWVNLRRIWAMLDSRICSSLCQSIHILMNEILILLKTPIKEINMLGFKNRSASSDMRMIFFMPDSSLNTGTLVCCICWTHSEFILLLKLFYSMPLEF
jgi:hypothetical protein